jgi:hypothetical protein
MPPASSESQSAIDVLKAENERLTKELTKATSLADKHKADLDTLSATHAELKKAAGDPEGHKANAEKYLGELRTLKHKLEFSKVAKAHGAKEDAIDDLYLLSGYKAEKDDVDAKAFESILGEMKTAKAYAFTEPAAEGEGRVIEGAGTPTPTPRPVPAAGRGPGHNPATTGLKISKDQMMDPKFMLNPANKAVIADAAKNRRFAR